MKNSKSLKNDIEFIINPRIYSKKEKNSWLILEDNKSYIRQLNDVAGYIWEHARKNVRMSRLIDQIIKKFHQPRKVVEKDVEAFITGYLKEGFFIPVEK